MIFNENTAFFCRFLYYYIWNCYLLITSFINYYITKRYGNESFWIWVYLIYFEYKYNTYYPSNKGRGTHFLEQIFDENNKLIRETIKENPHQVIITEEQIEKTRKYVEEYDKKLKKSVKKYKKGILRF